MILDAILGIFNGILSILFLPLNAFNFGVSFVTSIATVKEFLAIIAYVLPWSNLIPIINIIIAMFIFRITMAIIKTIWEFLPFV